MPQKTVRTAIGVESGKSSSLKPYKKQKPLLKQRLLHFPECQLLHLSENDDQCVQRQGLNQRQTENQ